MASAWIADFGSWILERLTVPGILVVVRVSNKLIKSSTPTAFDWIRFGFCISQLALFRPLARAI